MPADASVPAVPARPIVHALDWLSVLVVVTLAVFLASFAVRNSDFWLHLAAGRLITSGAYPFGLDPFSALDPTPVWINHAWLYDVLIFLINRSGGGMAIVIAKAAVVAAMAIVMLATRRRNSDGWLPVLFTAMALLTMAPRLLMQSTIVSLLMLAVLLFIVSADDCVAGGLRSLLPSFLSCGSTSTADF